MRCKQQGAYEHRLHAVCALPGGLLEQEAIPEPQDAAPEGPSPARLPAVAKAGHLTAGPRW